MDFDQARRAKLAIDASTLALLRKGLYVSGIRYANLRAEWKLLSTSERVENDPARTAAHDAFIDACNILSRNMAKTGEAIE